MRRPFIAGNWKLNLDRRSALELVDKVRTSLEREPAGVDVAVCPPYVYIDEVSRALSGSGIRIGAQNVCDEASGAFTGEVSASMLRDVGADLVIVGHSERRHIYGESNDLINRKVHRALEAGLDVILCVGETIEERQSGRTDSVVDVQLEAGLRGVRAEHTGRLTIAYEPVWAIGTGHTATPAQAGEVHRFLRERLRGLLGQIAAEKMRIQYGGSVRPDNIRELMAVSDIDGALVGGASLKADSFLKLVKFS